MRDVLPWSWSSYQAYDTCPRAFYEIKIAKNFAEDWERDYIIWGNTVHKALELRVGFGVPLPGNMQQYERMAASFVAAPGTKYVELETAIDGEFLPTGYWDTNCWNRGKEDLVIVNGDKAIDIDYKTGKPGKPTDQLKLSAARVMAQFEGVNTVACAFGWLADGTWSRQTFTRSMLADIWESFMPKVENMLWSQQNNAWPARPSGLCKRSRKPGSTYGGCIVATCPHSEYYRK